MKIYLVGGGTGGHFYPLIAVAEELRRLSEERGQDISLVYIGPEKYDAAELLRLKISFAYCPAGKWRRYTSFANLIDMVRMALGLVVAFVRLLFAYPDVVFSKGGYTSVPVVFAARLLRIPVVIHESDARMGRANELVVSYAQYIAVSYAHMTEKYPAGKTAYIGIPIRKEMRTPLPPEEVRSLPSGLDANLPTIFVIGGSLGAEQVNLLVLQSLGLLLPRYNIVHQTGKTNYETVKELADGLVLDVAMRGRYMIFPFLDSKMMHKMLSVADVVVSRAGSGSIAEIALHGKPSVLIPIPEEISHDQRTNAYTYANMGGAEVIEQENLKEHLFVSVIENILDNSERYIAMSQSARAFAKEDAAERIARVLIQIGDSH